MTCLYLTPSPPGIARLDVIHPEEQLTVKFRFLLAITTVHLLFQMCAEIRQSARNFACSERGIEETRGPETAEDPWNCNPPVFEWLAQKIQQVSQEVGEFVRKKGSGLPVSISNLLGRC